MAAKLIYLTDEEFVLLVQNLTFGSTTSDGITIDHKLVFMRDKFTCQRCSSISSLFPMPAPYVSSNPTSALLLIKFL